MTTSDAAGAAADAGEASVRAGTGWLARATGLMAVGTLLSRLTGLLRTVATVYALGFVGVSGDYNLANTIPNMVVDLVLGGVLSATFVPVFVERLASRASEEAWEAISAVVSVAVAVITVASLVFLVAAPVIVDVLTGLNHGTASGADRRLATDLLVLFVPQLTCYGFIALATAVLNARRRFAAPMFVPIANNVVLIVILVAFRQVVSHGVVGSAAGADVLLAHRGWLLLLGVGTTAGVIVQAVALIPALRGADLRLRWAPRFRHEAVRTVARLSGWTFGLVVANQISLTVILALSEAIGTQAVSAYTYSWQFFQLPYGVVAVSVMTATVPELSRHWTLGDLDAFRRRLAGGLRAVLAIIVPAAGAMVVLARPAVELLGHLTRQPSATATAEELAVLALGLPGFCVFLYFIGVLQSIQDMRSAFWLYALENGVTVVLAAALYRPLGVRGIAAAIAAAYTVAAVVALDRVRRRVHGLAADLISRPLRRILVATVVLLVATGAGVSVTSGDTGPALLVRVVVGALAGAVGYVGALAVTGALARRSRRQGEPDAPGPDPASEPLSGRVRPSPAPTRGRRPAGPPGGAPPGHAGAPDRPEAGPPGAPRPLPPAGRPPARPTSLGPLRRDDRDGPRGRLDP